MCLPVFLSGCRHLLILAGPGSGKTATLTNRILYCLSQGVEPSQILAVSFTNAAAAEMGSRLKKMLKEARKKGTRQPHCTTTIAN